NKVAVPEGAAGIPPFKRIASNCKFKLNAQYKSTFLYEIGRLFNFLFSFLYVLFFFYNLFLPLALLCFYSLVAQLVRALH
ncbi:MAG: hypothetical protein WBB26_13830, partial [Saprospiraceae bacterium]